MIANFFNKTKPINFVILSILMVFIFIIGLINDLPEDVTIVFVAKKIIFLAISILIIFFLNFIIRKNTLTDDNTYAILFFVLMLGFYSNAFFNKNIFIANFILLFAFRRIYSLRSAIEPKEKIFDSAFWIGVASLFYFWSIIYLPLLFGAIWVFKKRDWKNVFIPIIGFITPIFLLFTYLLMVNNMGRFYDFWKFNYSFYFYEYASLKYLTPILFLLSLTLISIFPTIKKSLLSKIDFKSTWTVLTTHILLSLLIVLIAPIKNGSEFLFLFFPLGILFTNFLQIIKRYWIKEVVLYLFLAVLIIVNVV